MTGEKLVESEAVHDGYDLDKSKSAHVAAILACRGGELAATCQTTTKLFAFPKASGAEASLHAGLR